VSEAWLRTEQVRSPEPREAFTPDCDDALDVGQGAGKDFECRIVALDVHRQGRPKVDEARMHFARDRTAERPRRHSLREEAGLGKQLVEMLWDGEGIPHVDRSMGQRWYQEGGREKQELGPHRGVIRGGNLLLEIEPGHLA